MTDQTDPFGEHHTAVQAHVALGCFDYEELAHHFVDENGGDGRDGDVDDAHRAAGRAALSTLFTDHLAWQESVAGEMTDAERLSRACRALDVAGVIAREEFGWGRGDIFHFFPDEREHAPRARGYACATTDDYALGVVSLRFGVFTDQPEQDPTEQAAIGREVVTALHAHGLDTDWDGDPGRVIDVRGEPGRRRRFGRWVDHPEAPDGTAAVASAHAGGAPPAIQVSFFDMRGDGGGIARLSDNAFVPVADRTWRELMYRLSPTNRSFMVFKSLDTAGSVQMAWEPGPRLWMEVPEPAHKRFRGAYVTLDQAETVVAALAADGRDNLNEVADHVEERPW